MKTTMAAERTYARTWEEIETMLARAEKKMRTVVSVATVMG